MPAVTKPYRKSAWRRALNALVRPLARLGLTGPRTYVLTVPGRTSGKLWSTPVSIVEDGDAAGSLRRMATELGEERTSRGLGRAAPRPSDERLSVFELDADAAVPVLREYYRLAGSRGRSSPSRSLGERRVAGGGLTASRLRARRVIGSERGREAEESLLVAATDIELCDHPGSCAASARSRRRSATARELALRPPVAVVHIGIAGGRGITPGRPRDRQRVRLLRHLRRDPGGRPSRARCRAARERARGTAGCARAADRNQRSGGRSHVKCVPSRGHGGFRRAAGRVPRRGFRRSRSGRSRTRSPRATDRAGASGARSSPSPTRSRACSKRSLSSLRAWRGVRGRSGRSDRCRHPFRRRSAQSASSSARRFARTPRSSGARSRSASPSSSRTHSCGRARRVTEASRSSRSPLC